MFNTVQEDTMRVVVWQEDLVYFVWLEKCTASLHPPSDEDEASDKP